MGGGNKNNRKGRKGEGEDASETTPMVPSTTTVPLEEQQDANRAGDDGAAAPPTPPPARASSGDRPPREEKRSSRTGSDRSGTAASPPRANYGAVDSGVTPARDTAASKAPPPTPATAYKKQETTSVMRHRDGAMLDEADSPMPPARSGSHGGDSNSNWDSKEFTIAGQLRQVFFDKWQLKLLLVTVPIAIFGSWMGLSSDILFFAAFFGLIPLAGQLGDFTEDLAIRSNDVIGALINVTFGNATELIISIMALRAGMLDVIKLSLIGSVLSNMLLVLGTAFVVGGIRHKDMSFNSDAVNTYGPLLMLSLLSYVIPSAYWATTMPEAVHASKKAGRNDSLVRHDGEVILAVSRQIAVVVCIVYGAYLWFQLVSHKHLFDSPASVTVSGRNASHIPDSPLGDEAGQAAVEDEDEEEEEGEEPNFTFAFALIGLAVVSVIISMLSEILVDTLSEAATKWNIPTQFIGIILVPIVGNAAEHASAIVMAARNKLDISVGVALGSSIQIAMFVMPVLVLAGWAFDVPLNLDFHPFLTVTTLVCVLVVENIVSDGKTNWLEGLLLVAAYVMTAILFWNASVTMD